MQAIIQNVKILFFVFFILVYFNDAFGTEDDSGNVPIEEIYFVNFAGDEPFKYQDEERTIKLLSAPSDDAEVITEFKIKIISDTFEVRTNLSNRDSHVEPVYFGLCGEKVLAVYPSVKREGEYFLLDRMFFDFGKELWVKAPIFKLTDPKEQAPLSYWYNFSEATFEKVDKENIRAHLIQYGKKTSRLINLSWLFGYISSKTEKLEYVCDANAINRQVSPKPAIKQPFEEPYFVEFNEVIEIDQAKPKFPDGCWNSSDKVNHENCRLDINSCKLSKSYVLKGDNFFIFDLAKKTIKEKESRVLSEIYLSSEMRQNIIVSIDKLFIEKKNEIFSFQDLMRLEHGVLTVKELSKIKALVGEEKPFTLNFQGECGQLKEREIHQRYPVFSSWKDDKQHLGEIFIGLAEGFNDVAFIDKNFANHSFGFNIHSGSCNESQRFIHQVKNVQGDWVNLGQGAWGENGWIRKKSYGFFTNFKAGFAWLDSRNSVNFRKKGNHIYAVGDRMINAPEEVDSQKIEVPVDYNQLFDSDGVWKIKLFCEYSC